MLVNAINGKKEIGAPGRIRTADPLVRSQVLYPTELRALYRIINNNQAVAQRRAYGRRAGHRRLRYGVFCAVC